MSRNYDNWERLVAAAIKKEQFRAMALAPPSRDTSFDSTQSTDTNSFASSSNRHDELVHQVISVSNGATPGGIAAKAALLFASPLAFYRRRKQQDHSFDFCADNYLGHLERFSLLELQVATDNFCNENIVSRNGFCNVYKGQLADGTLVAVKRLLPQGGLENLQFQMEVGTISLAVHPNILKLRGFCTTATEKLLVYPYMANGSVASCLRERPESQLPLDWPARKRIALGSARGVAYLNDRSLPIIHCDLKVANILLDEDFEAVVCYFGSAIVMGHDEAHVATTVRGTIGHIAPEYLSTGKVSAKSDVYGYGAMLLELVTGHKSLARVANDEHVWLLDRVRGLMKEKKFEMLVDTDLKGEYIDEEVEQLIQVALLCMQSSPNKRPNMSDVVGMLQGYGLAERWEESQAEIFDQEFNHMQYSDILRIFPDSSDNMDSDELSGPGETFLDSDDNVTDDELPGPR